MKYNAVMAEYLRKGYVQEVDKKRKSVEGSIWYLPHHLVLHPLKPEKVRIVFDCIAQYEGMSFNSPLLQGPDHTNKLVGVLIRFRQDKIALALPVKRVKKVLETTSCD